MHTPEGSVANFSIEVGQSQKVRIKKKDGIIVANKIEGLSTGEFQLNQ